ncbi:MAG: hypothetical protein IPQ27_09390 [Chitinophagaceae bacterium]|jgi:hypothetical protein|nr:hypothetical protein [Chitinophagaceae bacterium]MBK9959592.1 hypothetical protein [Chitinophagaceae bacterium]MBL0255157.1 hypothetical protein [Chitinophagaceae bacterium]
MHLLQSFFDSYNLIGFVIMIIIQILLFIEIRKLKEKISEKMELNDEGTRLKLQALERLTLFAERIGLQNLVNRSHNSNMSATLMQQTLVETIKSEHEYNATQQIYVNPEIWGAVTRLKDQNIYIINQLAAPLPHNATAMDLSKRIIEYSLQENAQLNNIVIDALRFEAQKLTD